MASCNESYVRLDLAHSSFTDRPSVRVRPSLPVMIPGRSLAAWIMPAGIHKPPRCTTRSTSRGVNACRISGLALVASKSCTSPTLARDFAQPRLCRRRPSGASQSSPCSQSNRPVVVDRLISLKVISAIMSGLYQRVQDLFIRDTRLSKQTLRHNTPCLRQMRAEWAVSARFLGNNSPSAHLLYT